MKSIKIRMVVNFLFIILITVTVLEILLINIVRNNYYKNLEDNLFSQIRISSDLYLKYFSDTSLHENVLNNVDTFWKQTTAQVEIIDDSGKILMDSIGAEDPNFIKREDVEKAREGKKGVWIGKVSYDSESVMAISYPLKSQNKIVGVLRFITSLREVNREIGRIALIFMGLGILVVLISSIMSIILASTITGPLREVTNTAEKMAQGNYMVRSKRKYDDEIGKLSDTLNYMAGEIVKKDQIKNDFISSISHELRTPLTSIKGWAITLMDGYDDVNMLMDGLNIIEKESDRLTKMVEELLDFSKFVSGQIKIENSMVDLKEVMEHIKKQLAPRAIRDNIAFNVKYSDSLPVIETDGNRLKQIFVNILDNAFKFTPSEGSIEFMAYEENKNIVFVIQDTGCGISSEELPRVKEKFYKGKTSKSTNGIGLSICDEIIRLMNGTFKIESELDKGTKVVITLPLLR